MVWVADWRENWGLPSKPRRNCPVCGNESVAGRKCHYHKRTEKRTEYYAAYYRANREKLSKIATQRMANIRLKRKLRPFIEELKKAVDLGRVTAGW